MVIPALIPALGRLREKVLGSSQIAWATEILSQTNNKTNEGTHTQNKTTTTKQEKAKKTLQNKSTS